MSQTADYQVLIAGGGPVGLLLANLLGRKGLRTLLVEENVTPPEESMAIGITPPSLELLNQLQLDQDFVNRGIPVRRVEVFENDRPAGRLSFANLASPYPFILALPQADTIELLAESLAADDHVEVRRGTRLVSLEQSPGLVRVNLQPKGSPHIERISAAFLAGCDGHRSLVRQLAGLNRTAAKRYPVHFLMADSEDETGLGAKARLYFSPSGSLESFPLPGRRRRWILQTETHVEPPDGALLSRQVRRKTGYDLTGRLCGRPSAFTPQRFICRRYFQQRVVLCGDAAHVMSPIGGQGMNTGFADAAYLAEALREHFCCGKDYAALFAAYDHDRRTAFKVAADRAARGMWLGTRRGQPASWLRLLLLKALLGSLFANILPAYFAMLTIPNRSLEALSGNRLQPSGHQIRKT